MPRPPIVTKMQNTLRQAIIACGINLYKRTEDRHVLEKLILPHVASRDELHSILFVGCDWYTKGYRKILHRKDYWTLDVDPAMRPYGAARHVIDSVEHIGRHFSAGHLDVIICNGVFGWGLNAKSDVERAFQGCFQSLRPGGIFILGWNDISRRRPFPPEECQSLRWFTPYRFPPLAASRYLVPNQFMHVYNFYIKEAAGHHGQGESAARMD